MELLYPYASVTLLVVRTTEQGKASMAGKPSELYSDSACCIYVSRVDLEKLAVKEGDPVEVSTESGAVVVRVKVDDELSEGMAYMPVGPWANVLIPAEGEVPPKAVAAVMKKADRDITDINELFSGV